MKAPRQRKEGWVKDKPRKSSLELHKGGGSTRMKKDMEETMEDDEGRGRWGGRKQARVPCLLSLPSSLRWCVAPRTRPVQAPSSFQTD